MAGYKLAPRRGIWLLVAVSVSGRLAAQEADSWLPIEIAKGETSVAISADGQPFCEYDFASYARPILYPLLAPGQVSLVRHWPMREGVAGEATDHPHHKSLWFAHGDVDGLDFWSEKARIRNVDVSVIAGTDGHWPGLLAKNEWDGADRAVCTESATFRFAAQADARFIDCQYELSSTNDVVFGDTKEGTFALRTHPALNLTQATGGPPPGHAENSEGQRDGEIWGQRARWVSYFGEIDGAPYGIAVFDHTSNLRHPTTWHARDYGLVAANPFGLHDFLGEPKSAGDYRLEPEKPLRLRYRVVLYRGAFDRAAIENWYADFARAR